MEIVIPSVLARDLGSSKPFRKPEIPREYARNDEFRSPCRLFRHPLRMTLPQDDVALVSASVREQTQNAPIPDTNLGFPLIGAIS